MLNVRIGKLNVLPKLSDGTRLTKVYVSVSFDHDRETAVVAGEASAPECSACTIKRWMLINRRLKLLHTDSHHALSLLVWASICTPHSG